MKRFYQVFYSMARIALWLVFPVKFKGRENIPAGPAIICANHSHLIDPFLVAFAFGRKYFIHFMAKIELLKKPVIGWILKKCGVFPVNRGESDINAVRTAMRYLKDGETVMIFPEGTRVSGDDTSEAKSGAVRLAAKMKVPIIPVYVPREKKAFKRSDIIIGKPFEVRASTHDEYVQQSDKLMDRIYALEA